MLEYIGRGETQLSLLLVKLSSFWNRVGIFGSVSISKRHKVSCVIKTRWGERWIAVFEDKVRCSQSSGSFCSDIWSRSVSINEVSRSWSVPFFRASPKSMVCISISDLNVKLVLLGMSFDEILRWPPHYVPSSVEVPTARISALIIN